MKRNNGSSISVRLRWSGGELSIRQIQDRPRVVVKEQLFWVWIIIVYTSFRTGLLKFSLLLAETVCPKQIDEIN